MPWVADLTANFKSCFPKDADSYLAEKGWQLKVRLVSLSERSAVCCCSSSSKECMRSSPGPGVITPTVYVRDTVCILQVGQNYKEMAEAYAEGRPWNTDLSVNGTTFTADDYTKYIEAFAMKQ